MRNRFLAARALGGARPNVESTAADGLTPPQQQVLAAMLKLTPEQVAQLPPQVQLQVYRIRKDGPVVAAGAGVTARPVISR